jgi:hypothetical protein
VVLLVIVIPGFCELLVALNAFVAVFAVLGAVFFSRRDA